MTPKTRRILLWALLLLWMALIYAFSNQTGDESGSLSEEVIRVAADLVDPAFDQRPAEEQARVIEQYQPIVRKTAHFGVYAVMGMLAVLAMGQYAVSARVRAAVAWSICAGYAALDEFHQSFVDARGSTWTDVLIDSSGALCGVLFFWLIAWYIAHRRGQNPNKRPT